MNPLTKVHLIGVLCISRTIHPLHSWLSIITKNKIFVLANSILVLCATQSLPINSLMPLSAASFPQEMWNGVSLAHLLLYLGDSDLK